jgi:hypothetical protein
MTMSKTFSYEGGPKDKKAERAEESQFPEIHPGGEYRWSGTSHVIGTGDPTGPIPDADRATAVWYSKDME